MARKSATASHSRPYRLWDAKAKAWVRWRYYASPHNAHNGVMREMKWGSQPGRVVELINVQTGKVLVEYTRRVNSIEWR